MQTELLWLDVLKYQNDNHFGKKIQRFRENRKPNMFIVLAETNT